MIFSSMYWIVQYSRGTLIFFLFVTVVLALRNSTSSLTFTSQHISWRLAMDSMKIFINMLDTVLRKEIWSRFDSMKYTCPWISGKFSNSSYFWSEQSICDEVHQHWKIIWMQFRRRFLIPVLLLCNNVGVALVGHTVKFPKIVSS